MKTKSLVAWSHLLPRWGDQLESQEKGGSKGARMDHPPKEPVRKESVHAGDDELLEFVNSFLKA